MISLVDGGKHYQGEQWVFRHVSIDFPKGKCVAIIGPTGCGKSTLVRSLLGLQPLDEGYVSVNGTRVSESELLRVGYVPQGLHLWPYRTARENVAEGLRFRSLLSPFKRGARREAEQSAEHWLVKVGLSGKEHRYPHELSGGEQQRVAIARALAIGSSLVVLDEPTSGLDPLMTGQIAEVLGPLRMADRTMVLISHQIQLIREMADTVYFLDKGRVLEEGAATEVLENPKTPEVQDFIKTVRRGW